MKITVSKIIAAIAIVLIVSGTILMSVEATRNYIFNALIKWHESHFSIENGTINEISTIESGTVYEPTYLPIGFEKASTYVVGKITISEYENEDGLKITLKHSPTETSYVAGDNEDKIYTSMNINGQKAHLFESRTSDKLNMLVWETGGCLLTLTSEIEANELILIAESIK
jgi:hypothetical protein